MTSTTEGACLSVLEFGLRWHTPLVEHNILHHSAEFDRVKDFGLALCREADALCIAATLNIEHTLVCPDVLVVANELSRRIGGERGLARAAQAKEDGDAAIPTTKEQRNAST